MWTKLQIYNSGNISDWCDNRFGFAGYECSQGVTTKRFPVVHNLETRLDFSIVSNRAEFDPAKP